MKLSIPFMLLLIFVSVPLVELVVLIQISELIGVWLTITSIVITALIGTWLLRVQGQGVLKKLGKSVFSLVEPAKSITEGLLLVLAGAFLLTPGFVTDCLGFVLLVPPVREQVVDWCTSRLYPVGSSQMCYNYEQNHEKEQVKNPKRPRKNPTNNLDDVEEAEFERLD